MLARTPAATSARVTPHATSDRGRGQPATSSDRRACVANRAAMIGESSPRISRHVISALRVAGAAASAARTTGRQSRTPRAASSRIANVTIPIATATVNASGVRLTRRCAREQRHAECHRRCCAGRSTDASVARRWSAMPRASARPASAQRRGSRSIAREIRRHRQAPVRAAALVGTETSRSRAVDAAATPRLLDQQQRERNGPRAACVEAAGERWNRSAPVRHDWPWRRPRRSSAPPAPCGRRAPVPRARTRATTTSVAIAARRPDRGPGTRPRPTRAAAPRRRRIAPGPLRDGRRGQRSVTIASRSDRIGGAPGGGHRRDIVVECTRATASDARPGTRPSRALRALVAIACAAQRSRMGVADGGRRSVPRSARSDSRSAASRCLYVDAAGRRARGGACRRTWYRVDGTSRTPTRAGMSDTSVAASVGP